MDRKRSSSMSERVKPIKEHMDPMLRMIAPELSFSHVENFLDLLELDEDEEDEDLVGDVEAESIFFCLDICVLEVCE